MQQKRVAAIHDISCLGKCSLTVALPIISAAGIECSIIPTAVLSTHTGGFTDYTCRDLTTDIQPISTHWQSLNISFDAIYTGYLASFEQVAIISQFFADFKNANNIIAVDPVMGDNGKLYTAFDHNFPKGMCSLCSKADLIMPNLTEAALLLDEPYQDGPYTQKYIEATLHKLAAIGPKQVVLTGVYFDENQLGAATYDSETDKIGYALTERINGYYHGTGDVFGSALVGALVNGKSLTTAAQIAADFTTKSIIWTANAKTDIRYGVNFEANLPKYIQSLRLTK